MSRLIFAQLAHVVARDAIKGEHVGHIYDAHKRTEVSASQFAHLSDVADAWLLRAKLYDYDVTSPMPLDERDVDENVRRSA